MKDDLIDVTANQKHRLTGGRPSKPNIKRNDFQLSGEISSRDK